MKFKFLILFLTLIALFSSCSENDSTNEISGINISNTNASKEETHSSFEELFSVGSDVSIISEDNDYSDYFSNDDESSCSSFESLESNEESQISLDDSQEYSNNDSSNDKNDVSNDPVFFNEPEGSIITTSQGNSFETNCSDENIIATMCEIADIASQYNHVTVYYTDITQKYYFCFGGQNIHNTASTIKAPYATYLLKSGADLSEKITLEQRHIQGGSGVLKNKEAGTVFSVKELIKYMITRSDNTAYAMLLERFGTSGFRDYAKSLGLDFKIPSSGYTTCTIREMATFMLDIYKFEETESGKFLIDCMKNCSYSLQIPKATSYNVAHKFGFIYEGKAFHDMGIVYAPIPYLELIFTKIDGTVYDTEAFIKIGKLVDKLNMQLSQNQ